MREYRMSLIIGVPAAIAIMGVIWLMRRKKPKKPKKMKTEEVKEQVTVSQEQATVSQEQIPDAGGQKDGLTITQRKIPKSMARDKGSDLHSVPGVMACQVCPLVGHSKDVLTNKSRLTTSAQEGRVEELINSAIDSGLQEANTQLRTTSNVRHIEEELYCTESQQSIQNRHPKPVGGCTTAQIAEEESQTSIDAPDSPIFVSQAHFNLTTSPSSSQKIQAAINRKFSGDSAKSTTEAQSQRDTTEQGTKDQSVSATACITVISNDANRDSTEIKSPQSVNLSEFLKSSPILQSPSTANKASPVSEHGSGKPIRSSTTSLIKSVSSESESQQTLPYHRFDVSSFNDISSTSTSHLASDGVAGYSPLTSIWATEDQDSNLEQIIENSVETEANSKVNTHKVGAADKQPSSVCSDEGKPSTPDSYNNTKYDVNVESDGVKSSTENQADSSPANMSVELSEDGMMVEKAWVKDMGDNVGGSGGQKSNDSAKENSPSKSVSPVGDSHSEGSNDSGRGGSDHENRSQSGDNLVHYDFNMPSELCGRFIGKQGKNINFLKSKTGANVALANNPFTSEYQICQVIGTQSDVDDALAMIRRKFPLAENPCMTMLALNYTATRDQSVVVPDVMQLSLPEGVSVEVYVSAIVDAGHVFVQQPTHRSFMSLEKLNYFLNSIYGQDPNIPAVPTPMDPGVICVCETEGVWYRTMIMSQEDELGQCHVKFVDYGGFATLPVVSLKQIRTDFMTLPFQAVECLLANITPREGEESFSSEANMGLCEMSDNKLLQCQVVARMESGIPHIHLYQMDTQNNTAVMINRALVNKQLVRWNEIL